LRSKLLNFIQTLLQNFDSQLIAQSHVSDTTVACVVGKCVAKHLQENLYNAIRKFPFSLMFDGSSDVYGDKYLTLLVRYIDINKECPVTKLISYKTYQCH